MKTDVLKLHKWKIRPLCKLDVVMNFTGALPTWILAPASTLDVEYDLDVSLRLFGVPATEPSELLDLYPCQFALSATLVALVVGLTCHGPQFLPSSSSSAPRQSLLRPLKLNSMTINVTFTHRHQETLRSREDDQLEK